MPVSKKGHKIFISFLRKSIEKLKLNKAIHEILMRKGAWSFGHNIKCFIRKSIGIKNFFPKLFFPLIKEFNDIIGRFNSSKAESKA